MLRHGALCTNVLHSRPFKETTAAATPDYQPYATIISYSFLVSLVSYSSW